MKLFLSILFLLINCAGFALAQDSYLHDGSIGTQKKPSKERAVSSPLSYRPIDKLAGEQFIFLPAPKSSQQYGYNSCSGGNDEFEHPLYREAVGRIGTIRKVVKDEDNHVVVIEMLDNKQTYKCRTPIEMIDGLGSIQDLDDAKRKWKGKAIWYKESKVRTYSADDDLFEELNVKKLSKGLIINVVAAWSSYTPVRIIFKLETGEEGYKDINPSGTNVTENYRDRYRFEEYFFSDDPKSIYRWPKHVWEAIEDDRVKIGMTKEQASLSWGKPKSINRTVTQNSVSEQWIYGDSYLFFTDGIVRSIHQ
jgi:hypothetical protein